MNKRAIVFGAGGFIGSHLVKRLKLEGYFIKGVDLKLPEFSETYADEFALADLRIPEAVNTVLSGKQYDELYQLGAWMGGAGFVFTGDNDAEIMHNSALININSANYAALHKVKKVFFSSSACCYPWTNQNDINKTPITTENSIYPANPDSEYGWEKIYSERLYQAYARKLYFKIRIARFHNIMGIEGTFEGGKEKAPAAICRKVINSEFDKTNEIEVWGNGQQKRTFLYIDECLEGVIRLMKSDYNKPLNIGSDEIISINRLAEMIINISGRKLIIKNIKDDKPIGVQTRTSDNILIKEILDWQPNYPLRKGLKKLYDWMKDYIYNRNN